MMLIKLITPILIQRTLSIANGESGGILAFGAAKAVG
jgi:hypothetical protein